MTNKDYVPALGYEQLTTLYDPILRLTMRETTFKRRLVERAQIQPGMRVLDVGCGTGTLTILAKQHQPRATLVGIDGDAAVLKRAQRKAARAACDVLFTRAFSFALPYRDNAYDCVLSSLLFHHLTREHKQRTLREIWRVLQPGGQLHIADWGKAQNMAMRGAFGFVQLLDGFATTSDSVAGKLPQFIHATGFVHVQETARYATMFGTLTLYTALKAV